MVGVEPNAMESGSRNSNATIAKATPVMIDK